MAYLNICIKLLLVSVLTVFYFTVVSAQNTLATLSGTVKDEKGVAVPFASVFVEELDKGTTADESGHFEFKEIPFGTYTLIIKSFGYKDLKRTIYFNASQSVFSFQMEEDVHEMEEVVVTRKTKNQEIKEQAIKTEVIDTKAAKEQPVALTELMNRSPGIRIRQMGGLGSTSNLMINGYQGRAIKYFKDGIPLDYLGAGYDISFVPVNVLERVEVYKGVLPVNLGADALGGALNLITRKSLPKFMEVSYEIGSFNTHRVSLNSYYSDTTHNFFVGADGFFNHSDNDYTVTAKVIDPESSTKYPTKVKVNNNKFTNYYLEAYGGVANTKWADELRIGLTGFNIIKEVPFDIQMTTPYGAVKLKQHSIIPTVRYRKSFLQNKLNVDQFFVANTIHVQQTDTAHGTYDWYGNFKPVVSRVGEREIQGSYSNIRYSYLTSRTHLSYWLSERHKAELNIVYTGLGRVGSDPYGVKFKTSGEDILSARSTYNKLIVSAGLQSKVYKDIVSNVFIVKYYQYSTDYIDADSFTGEEKPGNYKKSRWGVANAVKIKVKKNSFFRLSAEAATRLPEQEEIFGDGNSKLSNFELLPERSMNFNLGFRTDQKRFTLELNTFYRITKDLILNVAPVNFKYSQYQNVDQVKGLGFEADAVVPVWKWLHINGNFTYQDFRLFGTGNKYIDGARLRNTPYFFANLGLNSPLSSLFTKKDRLQLYWYYTFVREYYLDEVSKDKEPQGFLGLWGTAQFVTQNIIPNQNIQWAGFTYSPNEILSIGFQIKNLLNADIYDNFRVQNAGRSYHLKFNYILK